MAATYNRAGTAVIIDTIDVQAVETEVLDIAGTGGIAGVLVSTTLFDVTTAAADPAAVQTSLAIVETALAKLVSGASILGTAKVSIDLKRSFITKQMDAIDRGVSALIDADMNAESARLSALQVQQQLGVQSLSIANSNAQNILALFRN